MNAARALLALALALLAVPAPAAADSRLGLGLAAIERGPPGGRTRATGVALELGGDARYGALGLGATFTWGLTDWDRAREWIDAGNRAGSWTTDRLADIEAWVRRGRSADPGKDTRALRFVAAVFADLFLVATYVAVPACYVGSVGGATSHLQLDATASAHLSEGPTDAWVEGGVGGLVVPARRLDWDEGLGPVVGVGARLGRLRAGGRLLWSPPALNRSGERILTSAVTAGLVL